MVLNSHLSDSHYVYFLGITCYVFHNLMYYIYEAFIQWWNFLRSKNITPFHRCFGEGSFHFYLSISAWTQKVKQLPTWQFLFIPKRKADSTLVKLKSSWVCSPSSYLWINEHSSRFLFQGMRTQPSDEDLLSRSSESPSHSLSGGSRV